ncbi:MAG: hypothetical protein K6F92_06795 [Lachnospiraceae bacterium]|nr:hypothetical protein [Lachnospiraceae bacterium]
MSNRKTLFTVLNIVLFVCVFGVVLYDRVINPPQDSMTSLAMQVGYFSMFTIDSNVFSGVVAGMCAVWGIVNLKNDAPLPKMMCILYLCAATSLTLTFMTVLLFLTPVVMSGGASFFALFMDTNLFNHFLNPVLAVIGFTVVEKTVRLRKIACFLGTIPMVVYAIFYVKNVVILKKWPDFYYFTLGGRYELVPIVLAVIFAITLLFSFVNLLLHNIGIDRE